MDKITVIKGNVELTIPSDEKAYYMRNGYSVIDANGKIVEEAMLQDVASLQVKVAELQKQLAEKDEELQKLKAANKKKAVKE
jgi:spore coat polysaccharide biosynthesis predicted glycosyltransferase SpsG